MAPPQHAQQALQPEDLSQGPSVDIALNFKVKPVWATITRCSCSSFLHPRLQQAGCGATLTRAHYRSLLQAAGFSGIAITSTHEAGPGLHSAIIKAAKAAPRHPAHQSAGQDPAQCCVVEVI